MTVHRIDRVWTLASLWGRRGLPLTSLDNFFTHSLLQLQAGLPLLLNMVAKAREDKLVESASICTSISAKWYRPTLWTYHSQWFGTRNVVRWQA
jgi:hypothetical protein